MDFFTLSSLKRHTSFRRQRNPKTSTQKPAIRPTLDTSTGIIAIRYSDSPDTDSSGSSSPTSANSENSFEASRPTPITSTPTANNDSHNIPTSRPKLPQRSSSRRNTTGSRPSKITGERSHDSSPLPPTTLPSSENESPPPPIPAKSPYRASRVMVQLQHELAGENESPIEEEENVVDLDALSYFPPLYLQRSFYIAEEDEEELLPWNTAGWDDGREGDRISVRTV